MNYSNGPMEEKSYTIHYQFWFNKNHKKNFKVTINPQTILMVPQELENKPVWTKLEYNQCACCPLTKEKQSYCLIAVNIATIVETFKDRISHEKCLVRCVTPERIYQKKTSLMEGISSLIGLIMATSGCSVMNPFKPMARFHLPFSTIEETLVRATSMHLLRQYFDNKNDEVSHRDLNGLQKIYKTVKIVNTGILSRIKALEINDSDRNAILILHSISEMLSMEIDTDLSSIEYLFR